MVVAGLAGVAAFAGVEEEVPPTMEADLMVSSLGNLEAM